MLGPFGMRARTRKPLINITSLIDVMFLLLIFFMVSSTFRAQTGIDVTLPESQTAASLERSEYEITVAADGALYFQRPKSEGLPLSAAAQQAVTGQELREEIRAVFAEEPDAVLVLRADEGASFQDFITALDIARDEGGKRVVIPTEALPEQAPQP